MDNSFLKIRIQRLERIILAENLSSTPSFLSDLLDIKRSINTLQQNRPQINSFFNNYRYCKRILQEDKLLGDSPTEFLNEVSSSQEEIKNAHSWLRQLEEWKGSVESKAVQGLWKQNKQRAQLEQNHQVQMEEFKRLENLYVRIFYEYAILVESASELFLQWESQLATIEKNLVFLPKEK